MLGPGIYVGSSPVVNASFPKELGQLLPHQTVHDDPAVPHPHGLINVGVEQDYIWG